MDFKNIELVTPVDLDYQVIQKTRGEDVANIDDLDHVEKEFEQHIQNMAADNIPNITINPTERLEETRHILSIDK